MTVQVIKTTDKKHEGEIHTVPLINYQVMLAFGMHADNIRWSGDICVVQNSNYTIKLKKLGD